MDSIYHRNLALDNFCQTLQAFFARETRPTQETLTHFCLSFAALNCCPSVKRMYEQFINKRAGKGLSALYYTLDKAKLDRDYWESLLVEQALKNRDTRMTLFIAVDDTIVKKTGDHFDGVGILYNHTVKQGNRYVNGHCFVTTLLYIPHLTPKGIEYSAIPISHTIWTSEKSELRPTKLQIASSNIRKIIKQIRNFDNDVKIGILCDSWYPKGEVRDLINLPNVFMIANVRHDTRIFECPGTYRGKGRPPKHGKKIDISTILLTPVKNTDYSVAYFTAVIPLFFDKTVSVFVTACNRSGKEGSRRVFICSDSSAINNIPDIFFGNDADNYIAADSNLKALALYSLRWKIETTFYELKKFWGLNDYMIRNMDGIDRITNLQLLMYSLMSLLPWINPVFKELSEKSIQERRYALGRLLIEEGFLQGLATQAQTHKNSKVIIKFLMDAITSLKFAG